MPVIERPGATVAYEVSGSGPAVVFGHSLFSTRSVWRGVLPRLEDDFRILDVAMRGHGESMAEAPFTLEDLADDWLAVMDHEGIDRAVICGLSAGGMTALRLAARAPRRVAGMAVLGGNADPETLLNRIRYRALGWAYARFGILPKKTLLDRMYAPSTITERADLVDGFLEQAGCLDRSQLAHAMSAVFKRGSVDVKGLIVPALVIIGEHDKTTPIECARKITSAIEGASLEVIEGAGHLTAEEEPELVAKLLAPFFERCFVAG